MFIDITLKITPQIYKSSQNSNPSLVGHLGTHFDAMDKEFPLEYTRLQGIVFDVSNIKNREIGSDDVDLSLVANNTFIAFYSGFGESVGYGNEGYFSNHPQLSYELINALLDKGVAVIGVDFAGIRRGKEHTPIDQLCADRGTFVVENLVNLKRVLENGISFIAHTYPMNFIGITGLPCRVIAEV